MKPPSPPSAPFSPPRTPLDPPTISTSLLVSDLSDPSHTYTSPTFHWESDCFELPPEMRITWDAPCESVKLTMDEASAIGYEVLPLPPTQDRERDIELEGALERLGMGNQSCTEEKPPQEHLATPGRVRRVPSVRSLCTSPLLTHHTSCRRDKSATTVGTSSTHETHRDALPEHEGLPVRFDSWIHSDRDHACPSKPPHEPSQAEASALKPKAEDSRPGSYDDRGRFATPELIPDLAETDSAGTDLSLPPQTPPPHCAVDTITINDKVVTLSGDSVAIQSIKTLLKTHLSTPQRDPADDSTPLPRTDLRDPETSCDGLQLLRGYVSSPAPASLIVTPDEDEGVEKTAPLECESDSIGSNRSPSKGDTMIFHTSDKHALDEHRATPDTNEMTKQHAGQSQQADGERPPSPPTVTVWRPSSTPEVPDMPHQSSLRPQTPQRPRSHLLPHAPSSPWSSTSSQRFRFHEEQYEFQHLAAGMPEQMTIMGAGLPVKEEATQLSISDAAGRSRSRLDILASEAAKKVGAVSEDKHSHSQFPPKHEVLNPTTLPHDDLFTKDDKRSVLKTALLMDLSPNLAISMQDLISGQNNRQSQCRPQDWLPVGMDPLGSDSMDGSSDSEGDTPVKKAVSRYMAEDEIAPFGDREESLPPPWESFSSRTSRRWPDKPKESRSPSPPPRKKPAASKKKRATPKTRVRGSVDHAEDHDVPSQASLREQILTIGPLDEALTEQPAYRADEPDEASSQTSPRKGTRQLNSRKRPADREEDQQDGEDRQEDDSVASGLQMRQSTKKAKVQIKPETETLVKPKRKVTASSQASSSKGSRSRSGKTTFILPSPVTRSASIARSQQKKTPTTITSPTGSSFTSTTGRETSEDPLALQAIQDEDLNQYGDEDAEGEEDDCVEYTADDLVNMAEDGARTGRKGEDEDRKRVRFQRGIRAAKARNKKAQKKETVQESAHQRRYEPEEDAILREVWASKSSFNVVKDVFAEAQTRLLEAGYRERSLDALKYRMTSSASKFVAQYSPRKPPQPQKSQTSRGGKQ